MTAGATITYTVTGTIASSALPVRWLIRPRSPARIDPNATNDSATDTDTR